jgi:superfamily II DNA/RNA helicase
MHSVQELSIYSLVATAVAARGINIKDVDLVVRFSPPREVDTYVHHPGRTGPAGQKGTSALLFDPSLDVL